MNRRKFLQFLSAGAGVAAVAAVAPGAVKFFLPPKGGWKSAESWNHLSIDEFERRILEPAIQRLSADIDKSMCGLQMGDVIQFENVFNLGPPKVLKQFIVTSVS